MAEMKKTADVPSPLTNLGRFMLLGEMESGPLGRMVLAPRWPVPQIQLVECEFEDHPHGEVDPDSLPSRSVYQCLEAHFRDDRGRPVGHLVRAEETRGLLTKFLALAAASDRAIVEFASTFGILGLCWCELPRAPREPFTHRRGEITRPMMFSVEQSDYRPQGPLACAPFMFEPLQSWRRLAKRADQLLRRAISLREGARKKTIGSPEWQTLMNGVNWWLVRSGAYPYCLRPEAPATRRTGWRVGLNCQTVFDFLAVQLMDVVFHADLILPCSNCSELFQARRRPAAGRQSFCGRCGKNKVVSWRLSKRRLRQQARAQSSLALSHGRQST